MMRRVGACAFMRLLEVTETLEGFRCGVKMRADRRYACGSRARQDPQRLALDVVVRTRCGRKTLLAWDLGALLLSMAPARELADCWPRSIENRLLWKIWEIFGCARSAVTS